MSILPFIFLSPFLYISLISHRYFRRFSFYREVIIIPFYRNAIINSYYIKKEFTDFSALCDTFQENIGFIADLSGMKLNLISLDSTMASNFFAFIQRVFNYFSLAKSYILINSFKKS